MSIKKLFKFTVKILIIIVLIGGAMGSAISALWTVFPDSSASKESMLGYKSHCSFTPISTIILAFIAVLFTYILFRKKLLFFNN